MAAYDFTILQPGFGNSPTMGTFWVYKKLDLSLNPLAIADSAKIIKLKDLWVVMDSYWRMTIASTAGNTWDIGTVDASSYASTDQGILAGGSSAAGNWAQGVPDRDANQIILTEDRWVFVENLTAAVYDGVLEVMLEIMAGPDDNEAVDHDFG
jgi:hypothetical protein